MFKQAVAKEAEGIYSDLEKKGWGWICYEYSGHTWKFNPYDIASGDNLTKFIYLLTYVWLQNLMRQPLFLLVVFV